MDKFRYIEFKKLNCYNTVIVVSECLKRKFIGLLLMSTMEKF